MFVILAYDVQSKRIGKVMKTVKKYLSPIQRSVFEGYLTEGQVKRLKKELLPCIDTEHDAIVLYKSTFHGMIVKDCIGLQKPLRDIIL